MNERLSLELVDGQEGDDVIVLDSEWFFFLVFREARVSTITATGWLIEIWWVTINIWSDGDRLMDEVGLISDFCSQSSGQLRHVLETILGKLGRWMLWASWTSGNSTSHPPSLIDLLLVFLISQDILAQLSYHQPSCHFWKEHEVECLVMYQTHRLIVNKSQN